MNTDSGKEITQLLILLLARKALPRTRSRRGFGRYSSSRPTSSTWSEKDTLFFPLHDELFDLLQLLFV